MSNNLIQCGHCNGNAFIDADFGPGWVEYWAECGQCGVRTQEYTTEEQAASVWNSRPAPPRAACDGNHAAPACADPECWQRPSPVAPDASDLHDKIMRHFANNGCMPLDRDTTQMRALSGGLMAILSVATPSPVAPEPTPEGMCRAALLWVLWHHQGGSSDVGQPIRFALGMGAHEPLSAEQVEAAKSYGALTKKWPPDSPGAEDL